MKTSSGYKVCACRCSIMGCTLAQALGRLISILSVWIIRFWVAGEMHFIFMKSYNYEGTQVPLVCFPISGKNFHPRPSSDYFNPVCRLRRQQYICLSTYQFSSRTAYILEERGVIRVGFESWITSCCRWQRLSAYATQK